MTALKSLTRPAPRRVIAWAPSMKTGAKAMTLRGAGLVSDFKAVIEDYVARRYGGAQEATKADPSAAAS